MSLCLSGRCKILQYWFYNTDVSKIVLLMELKRKWPPAINRLSHLIIHIYNHLVFLAVFTAGLVVVSVCKTDFSEYWIFHSSFLFLASAIGDTEKEGLNMWCRKISLTTEQRKSLDTCMSVFCFHHAWPLFLFACTDISGLDFCLGWNFSEGEKGGAGGEGGPDTQL